MNGSELDRQLTRLLQASPDIAFLIVQIGQSREDFIQYAAHEDSVLFDFPMTTKRQSEREPSLRSVCEALDLELTVNALPDGSTSLNCDVPRDAAALAHVTRSILKEAFDVTDESKLVFENEES